MVSESPIKQFPEAFKSQTVGTTILIRGGLRQIQNLVSELDSPNLRKLKRKLQADDEIALAIGSFPLLHCQSNGEYAPYAEGCRLGINFHLDLSTLMTFLDNGWLSSSAIGGTLTKLAEFSPGVQLMSSEKVFYHLCKLRQNQEVKPSDVIHLHANTHTLVFPFNLGNHHWCVAKATFHKEKRLLTVYNSIHNYGTKLINFWLPAVLDCIINANLTLSNANTAICSPWSISRWAPKASGILEKVVLGKSLIQKDTYNCGVFAIFNTLALVQQHEPSFESINPQALRIEYAQALVKAV